MDLTYIVLIWRGHGDEGTHQLKTILNRAAMWSVFCHSVAILCIHVALLQIGERVELLDGGVTARPVHRFLGIPYSQPPMGDHRWRPPRPALPFDKGWMRATEWPDSCPNLLRSPSPLCRTCSTRSNPPIEPNSEDCLKLNVFAPDGSTPDSRHPVMV